MPAPRPWGGLRRHWSIYYMIQGPEQALGLPRYCHLWSTKVKKNAQLITNGHAMETMRIYDFYELYIPCSIGVKKNMFIYKKKKKNLIGNFGPQFFRAHFNIRNKL